MQNYSSRRSDLQILYQEKLKKLQQLDIRSYIDETTDPISGKIKRAQLDKIPWMLVIGNKEQQQEAVTLRYSDGTQKPGISLEELCNLIREE